MSSNLIPFNKPSLEGNELHYLTEAVSSGHAAGDGQFTRRCQDLLEQELSAAKVLLTTSCTDALEMAALLLRLDPGDEVIVPSFTFVSTPGAFVLHGATPVFVDVRPDTLNIDEERIEKAIGPRTRALVAVHYAGVGCEMDRICAIADRRGLVLIEDNAHGLFGQYRGKALGSFGAMATLSFHETKNFSCGEGGALVLNDPIHGKRADILRDKGTNRKEFLCGQVDKYTWVDRGSSFLPSDLLAAFLLAQLERKRQILMKRQRIWECYSNALATWAHANGATLPFIPDYCQQAFHMFYLLMPSAEARNSLIEHLKQHEILAVFHYQPLHASPMGRRLGRTPEPCPVTEAVSERLLRLPFFNSLSDADLDRIISAVVSFQP